MVLSSEDFLLCVTIGCFLIFSLAGIIYTIWCCQCCKIPKAADDEEFRKNPSTKTRSPPIYVTQPLSTSGRRDFTHPQFALNYKRSLYSHLYISVFSGPRRDLVL